MNIVKLVAYLRDSGGDKQELSVPQQRAAIERWALENGVLITAWFADEARPGSSTVGRAEFRRLMAHFRSPDCSERGLVIWKMSRFAREFDDAAFYKADLRRRGYRVVSLNDNIPDGPEGRLIEAAIDWMNDRFLEDLSDDVKRGLLNLVEQYGAVPGTPPRGFIRSPIQIGTRRDGKPHIVHKWIPDPETAHLVTRAFQMKAAGKSLAEILAATRLYKGVNGYTKTFFSNRIYIGILDYAGMVIDGYCEPLVDMQTWNAVQARLRTHTGHLTRDDPNHPRRRTSAYLLSGLIYCAHCGAPLSGLSAKQRNGSYYERYACTRAKRNRDCDFQPIPRLFLEETVLGEISEYILTPGVLAEAQKIGHNQASELDEQRRQIITDLAAIRRKITNLTTAIADAGHSRSLLDALASLEIGEYQLLGQLAVLEHRAKQEPAQLSASEIAQMAGRLKALLLSQDPETVREILRGFIARITIERDEKVIRGLITWYYPPDTPPPKAFAPRDDTVSMVHDPLGAPAHRHSFTRTIQRKKP